MTKDEAVSKWINGFNLVPREVSELLFENDKLYEITPIAKGSYVYVSSSKYDGYATAVNSKGLDREGNALQDEYGDPLDNYFMIEPHTGVSNDRSNYIISADEMEHGFDSYLPMWNNMWAFGESPDEYWVDNAGGLEALAECGFRVYETDAYGYVFGIDGMGYSFKEEHFKPLYEARGLKWHKEEIEVEVNGFTDYIEVSDHTEAGTFNMKNNDELEL